MIKLQLPVTEEAIRQLKVGDDVLLSGVMVTGRDRAHKYMIEKRPDDIRDILKNTVIYHCGPVMKKHDDGKWEVVAAGPTTSIREEPYQADVIAEYGIRGVIGKGGMGAKTLAGLQKSGAVYFHAIGGLSQVLARCFTRVIDVHKLEEFGVPEAFWVLEAKDFPVVVTMDANGNSMHEEIGTEAERKMKEIFQRMGK